MDIDAFILIGGRSSRFGSDKAAIEFGGKSLVERTAETIQDAISPSHIKLVAAREHQFSGNSGLPSSLPIIFDRYKERGPLGGLFAALSDSHAEWVLLLACDLPFLTSDLIRRLSGMISDEFDAIAPIQRNGKIQPVCALYRVKSCRTAIEEMFAIGGAAPAIHIVFDNVRTRFVNFDEICDLPDSEIFFLNINTPEDFQRATQIETESAESI